MDKTLKYILIGVIVIGGAWFLSGILFPQQQSDNDLLAEIDALDTELNTEVVTGRINNSTRDFSRKRILELLEILRKRGKKVCRADDGTIFIQQINIPCKQQLT